MNEAERRVLRNNKQQIKDNLNLEASILDELEQGDTLTEYQIHTIEAEKTNEDQIKQLLHFLPRRGPHAFTRFINAIRKNSSFLAEILEKELNKELGRNVETNQDNHSNTSPSCEDVSMESLPPINDMSTVPKHIIDTELKPTTNINTRKYLTHSTTSTVNSALLQQNLNSLYTKLKTHMTSNSMRELSFHSPQPVSFDMIDELLEDLFTTLDKCYNILGGKDRSASLLTLIIELKQANNELKNTLKIKEEQRNKYADNIMKLENKCRDKQVQADRFKKELENLKKENNSLQKQVQEADTKQRELENNVKLLEDETEKQKVAKSNEVESEELKDKNEKLCEEIEELKRHTIELKTEQKCPKCLSLIKQESSNNNAVLNSGERTSKRGTPTITGKTGVRQRDKDKRRDSHGSSLTETELKFLQRIQQQNNERFQPNVYHSQTKLDVKETGRLHQHSARFQPNIYHSQPKLDVKETGRLHPNTRAGYTEQVRRHQLNQSTTGLQQGVTFGPSVSRRNPTVARSYGSLNVPNPAMPMASHIYGNTRISDESKRKFFGALSHAKR